MAKYSELLRNRNFVLYILGQMISQFGDRIIQIALIGIVHKISPGSTLQLAKMLFFTVAPAFFISPIAGVYVDRQDKKKILIASDIVRSVMVCAIPFFLLNNSSLVPVYCVIFIIFSSACFFLPAKLAIIPDLIGKERFLMANSISTASWTVAGITGFTIGAFLVEFLGIKKGLYLNSLIYAASFIVLSFLSLAKKSKGKIPLSEIKKDLRNAIKKSFFQDLKEGLFYAFSHKKIRAVIIIFFVFMSCVGSLYVVGIVFIQELTHSVTSSIGIFGAFLFFGFLAGSYGYGKYGNNLPRNKTIFISFILSGFSICAFAVGLKMTGSFSLSYLLLFLLGIFLSPIASASNTIIHETIDEGMRGRIFSSIGIIMNIGFIAFMFISSFLAEHIDRMWVIVGCSLILSFVGFAGYALNRKEGINRFSF